MNERLKQIVLRFEEVTELLSSPDVVADQKRYATLSKEHSDLQEIVDLYKKYERVLHDLEANQSLISAERDREMISLAQEELEHLTSEKTDLEEQLKLLLLPKHPDDSKDVVLEIRAGTGGEEAALFAADLFRMYSRYTERKGWRVSLVTANETGKGGFKEIVVSINGKDVYGTLKYESGVHRVQRVPETEASGRVHTSAASVVVMPEVEDVDVEVDPKEIRIDVFRSGGAGGQNVNKVETAIRITHIPTGIVVQCQDERSQHQNRLKAMMFLRAKLYDLKQQEQDAETSAQRRALVKRGDRSDKIRTYNFPQNRVTDHRIGYTMHNLTDFINGDIDEMIEQLQLVERSEKLNEGV
jgi:peptide chain release factor 1